MADISLQDPKNFRTSDSPKLPKATLLYLHQNGNEIFERGILSSELVTNFSTKEYGSTCY